MPCGQLCDFFLALTVEQVWVYVGGVISCSDGHGGYHSSFWLHSLCSSLWNIKHIFCVFCDQHLVTLSALLLTHALRSMTSTTGHYHRQGVYVFTCACLFDGYLVCQQDYTKSAEEMSMKLDGKLGLSPEQTPFTFRPQTN